MASVLANHGGLRRGPHGFDHSFPHNSCWSDARSSEAVGAFLLLDTTCEAEEGENGDGVLWGEQLPPIPRALLTGIRTCIHGSHRTAGETILTGSDTHPLDEVDEAQLGVESRP